MAGLLSSLSKKLKGKPMARAGAGHSLQGPSRTTSPTDVAKDSIVPARASEGQGERERRERMAAQTEARAYKGGKKSHANEVTAQEKKAERWRRYDGLDKTAADKPVNTAKVGINTPDDSSTGHSGAASSHSNPNSTKAQGGSRLLKQAHADSKRSTQTKAENWRRYQDLGDSTTNSSSSTAVEAEGREEEGRDEEEPDGEAISSAIAMIREAEGGKAALKMTLKILTNVLNSPEDKYRRIKINNPKIQEKLLGVAGSAELLMLAGFQRRELPCPKSPSSPPSPASASYEAYLVFVDPDMRNIRAVLESVQLVYG